ncbi:amidase family protein [Afifella sp. IM 167]|uniref:amidase family protein n=1 Tax=Afifella sp. IM 167 TaxID=2033586 RepID=UPI001CCB1CA8|nr:amidase family protein [Afifella sp. IM 167]
MRFRAIDQAREAIGQLLDIDPQEAGRIFARFDAEKVCAEARRIDGDASLAAGPLAGLLVTIKDLFDIEGEVTTAGSRQLAANAPADKDAEAVRRLRAAGALPFGRTSMSEFAYSGVGLNPHFGTPGNSHDRTRIPGGSTSGGAVAVALGLCDAALGTDTGGSVRIPAALNGLAGFKPSQKSVPRDGVFPLSPSCDSIGAIAPDIATCAAIHAVLSGEAMPDLKAPARPRLGVMRTVMTDGMDGAVAEDFEATLKALSAAGAELVGVTFAPIEEAAAANRAIVSSEAHQIHRAYLSELETTGDPHVLKRIRFAETLTSEDLEGARRSRAEAQQAFAALASDFDAFVAPTVPVLAPGIEEVEADFDRLNGLVLRNPSCVNFLDGCAATVPMSAIGELATGSMIFAPAGADWKVLALAERFEALLSQ